MKTDESRQRLLNDVLFDRSCSDHKQATRERCLTELRRRRSTIVRLRFMTLAAAACLVVGFALPLLFTSEPGSMNRTGKVNRESVTSGPYAGLPVKDQFESGASALKMITPRSEPAIMRVSTRRPAGEDLPFRIASRGGSFQLIDGAASRPMEPMATEDIQTWLPNVSFALMTSDNDHSELYLPSEADRKRLLASSP